MPASTRVRGAVLFPLLFAALPFVRAYNLSGEYWASASIVMQLQLGSISSPLLDGSASWGTSAEDALATWNNSLTNMRFTVVRDSTAAMSSSNGLNNVFYSSTVYGTAWGTRVLAVTLQRYSTSTHHYSECDVLFNTNVSWNSYRGALRTATATENLNDFHRVALHEFGHVLGLNHPDDAGQTVTAQMNSIEGNLDSLAADDINGARAIYDANVALPTVATQPTSQTLATGSTVTFTVIAGGTGPFAYQWYKNGVAIAGATSSTLTLTNISSGTAGAYTVKVTNAAGAVTSDAATLAIGDSHLYAIACRALVGTGANILIPGIIVGGSGQRQVIVRAGGSAIQGVSGTLAQPQLTLYKAGASVPVATNIGWSSGTAANTSALQAAFTQAGLPAYPIGSADCAVLATLDSGAAYTAQVGGVNSSTGVALVEVYEVGTGTARMTAIACRAQVGVGGNVLIPGIIISGTASKQVIIRASGPALASQGVSGTLAQPQLQIYNSSGTLLAQNVGWSTAGNTSAISTATAAVGLPAFPAGSADCAILGALPPGAYTAQVSGINNSGGVALIEVYEVP